MVPLENIIAAGVGNKQAIIYTISPALEINGWQPVLYYWCNINNHVFIV